MVLENFSMTVAMTDPYPCLWIWDDFAFARDQFKPNQTKMMTFHQKSLQGKS